MRGIPHSTKLAFLRRVYREAEAKGLDRGSYLDSLQDTALEEAASGKVLISTTAGGVSASYSVVPGWTPGNHLALCEWARAHIAAGTVEGAMAGVSRPVTSFRGAVTWLRR